MRLRVDVLPRSTQDVGFQPFADTVLVVDTLRATTTAITYLEQGANNLYLCADLEAALAFKGEGVVLAGERNCLPPEGFDLGNSPVQALDMRFDGQSIVMSTSTLF
jgi:2-phosphosulfolactate phosphatase